MRKPVKAPQVAPVRMPTRMASGEREGLRVEREHRGDPGDGEDSSQGKVEALAQDDDRGGRGDDEKDRSLLEGVDQVVYGENTARRSS